MTMMSKNFKIITWTNSSTNQQKSEASNDIRKRLTIWAIKYQVNQNAVSDLLKLLKQHKCFENDLPSDARTLLRTPRCTDVREVQPGKYVHFGLLGNIINYLKQLKSTPELVCVQINIDGLPIANSSGNQFRPILYSILDSTYPVFTVGLYSGYHKPESIHEYLKDFVEESCLLYKNGISYSGETVNFKICAFICDAPARAYITQIKSHTGYFGCGKCTVKGKYVDQRVALLKTTCELRTDASFRERKQQKHHNGNSILKDLPIDMVNSFPYEYMHLTCLGVMRKLLFLWIKGERKIFKLSRNLVNQLDEELRRVRQCTPLEFARKPRSSREADRWKATELRQLLLYTGPVVLKKSFPKNTMSYSYPCIRL
ncbi:hypothetical protein Ocin01_05388 [Orchesella cincta]|uniref:DUF4806 domain-containing protein n=1 Tax=Orchesella cincta TaxID=48709 RepID=A0A1D2N7T6_ORCCI|nr:hypothetical protein Ocin01_05388 [Orchesella cincta]